MRSDERIEAALRALAEPRETFRSAVARAVDEVRGLLGRSHTNGDSAARHGAQLGAFAAGRIDVVRFDALFARGEMLDAAGVATVRRALATLEEIAAWNEDGFLVRVEPGHDLRSEVAAALAVAGRAFGAARAVELVRSRRFHAAEHMSLLGPFAPVHWNRAERQIAPPLVIEIAGGDLRAGGLSEFMEGGQKLVLVVRGPAPPAALTQLITPRVLVAQTAQVASLAAFISFDGPAVIALVPEDAALFVHDPRGGERLRDRLSVDSLPEGGMRGPLGSHGAFQRQEELGQLRALHDAVTAVAATAQPEPAVAAGATAADGVAARADAGEYDPAARLAALLLHQADLSGL
jgi:hypothetical protein